MESRACRGGGQSRFSDRAGADKSRLTSNLSMNSLIPSLSPVRYLGKGAIVAETDCFFLEMRTNYEAAAIISVQYVCDRKEISAPSLPPSAFALREVGL